MKRIVPSALHKPGPPSRAKQPATRPKNGGFRSALGRSAGDPRVALGEKGLTSRAAERRVDGREDRDFDAPRRDRLDRRDVLRGDPIRVDEFLYNPVLLPAAAASVTPAPSVPQTSALERAQAAALAERVLHSVQVGRIQGGHLVRLRLSSEVEVQLRHCDGVLQATVVGDGDQGGLARRLDSELRARGLRFDRVELG